MSTSLKIIVAASAVAAASAGCCCATGGYSSSFTCDDSQMVTTTFFNEVCEGAGTPSDPIDIDCSYMEVSMSEAGCSAMSGTNMDCSWQDDGATAAPKEETTPDPEGKCCCVQEVSGMTMSSQTFCSDDQFYVSSFMGETCSGSALYSSNPSDLDCSLVSSVLSEDGCSLSSTDSATCAWIPGASSSGSSGDTTAAPGCECLGTTCQATSLKTGLSFNTLESKYDCVCSACDAVTSDGPCDATKCLDDTCQGASQTLGLSLAELEETYACDCTGCTEPVTEEGCTWWQC